MLPNFPVSPRPAECTEAIKPHPEFRESIKKVAPLSQLRAKLAAKRQDRGSSDANNNSDDESEDASSSAGSQRLRIFNYDFCHRGTFPDPKEIGITPEESRRRQLLRECRGLLFDAETGALLARRFHKFFNVDQNDECAADKIDWTRPFTILEKLDGSLVSPVILNGEVRWGSKQGPTAVTERIEVGGFLEERLAQGIDYEAFAREMLERHEPKLTPLFEWCSLLNHIVIEYPEDRLSLIGLRENESGRYLSHEQFSVLAKKHNIPVTRKWQPDGQDQHSLTGRALIDHFMGTLSTVQGIEGFVICFYDDQEMYKIKTQWYFDRSNANQRLPNSERETWSMVLDQTLDDILPYLSHRLREQLETFSQDLFAAVENLLTRTRQYVEEIRAANEGLTKKDFVAQVMGDGTPFPSSLNAVLFQFFEGDADLARMRRDLIRQLKGLTKPKTFPSLKAMLNVEYPVFHNNAPVPTGED